MLGSRMERLKSFGEMMSAWIFLRLTLAMSDRRLPERQKAQADTFWAIGWSLRPEAGIKFGCCWSSTMISRSHIHFCFPDQAMQFTGKAWANGMKNKQKRGVQKSR